MGNNFVYPQGASIGDASVNEGGLTLRDYLAAKAMSGMLVGVDTPNEDWISDQAYILADAMLNRRDPRQKTDNV